MGTRSLTKFYEHGADKPFAVLYRQFDGYPDAHGAELAEFLAARVRLNGIPVPFDGLGANGIGCLAAQAVSHFKGDAIGSFYLQPDRPDGESGEEYAYEVRPDGDLASVENRKRGGWLMTVKDVPYKKPATVLWQGPPQNFDPALCVESE